MDEYKLKYLRKLARHSQILATVMMISIIIDFNQHQCVSLIILIIYSIAINIRS